jgi:hypothetical protein
MRRCCRASCAGSVPTSRPIGQPLALGTLNHLGSEGGIVNAQRHAMVVPEIELTQVAVQVALLAVLVRPPRMPRLKIAK